MLYNITTKKTMAYNNLWGISWLELKHTNYSILN